MALDKELRRRDVLFSLAEIERCPFSETNGTELDYLQCFGPHMREVLMETGVGGKGRREGGREGKGAYSTHGHTRCMGRHGSCRFVVFSFPSCLFSLALLWSHANHSWQIFFYSFGGVGTEQVISCWFGSENLNHQGGSLVQFLES